jgi:hypothetical protein
MLRKSYPMRDHEDRRWSMREINSPEKPKAPEPQETQYVLRIARSLYDAHVARRAAHGLPPSPNLAPADEPPDPTAAPATPSPEQATPQSAPDEDEGEFPGRFSFRGNWPLNHHRRHCTICKHPFRTAIEEEFLHWASPDSISHHYDVGWRSVYRHAHALGLFDQRGRNLRSALGHIIEHANHVSPTADTVVRAIRAYACVNKSGKWIEPVRHVEFSSVESPRARRARKRRKSEALPESAAQPDSASRTIDLANELVPELQGGSK